MAHRSNTSNHSKSPSNRSNSNKNSNSDTWKWDGDESNDVMKDYYHSNHRNNKQNPNIEVHRDFMVTKSESQRALQSTPHYTASNDIPLPIGKLAAGKVSVLTVE